MVYIFANYYFLYENSLFLFFIYLPTGVLMFFYFDFYECCHESVCEIKHVFSQKRCLFPQLEFENKTDQGEWDLVQIVEVCPLPTLVSGIRVLPLYMQVKLIFPGNPVCHKSHSLPAC